MRTARRQRLVYLLDDVPGYRRVRKGLGFCYLSPAGRCVRRTADLRRFRSLAIPPAWEGVWISPMARGHLQATGRDARGRKQYRYHPDWQEQRNATKFDRLAAFGRALPKVRRRVRRALSLPGLPREKIVAAVVHLLDLTSARIGNEEYAEANGSYGISTLRTRHFAVEGSRLRLRFRGKSGVKHTVEVEDRRLLRIVRRCSELPGELLFQFEDETGTAHPIGSGDVNELLREWTGEEFSAKDFRTWKGSVFFLHGLLAAAKANEPAEVPRLTEAIRAVATKLGNTPTVCRKYYIHPALTAAYPEEVARARLLALANDAPRARLAADEAALLHILRQ